MLLDAAEARLAEVTVGPPDAELTALLRAARARVWRAVNTLEAPADAPAWWHRLHRLARRRGWLAARLPK